MDENEKITIEEGIESLNQFDEDNIKKHFGLSPMEMEKDPMKVVRGLIWVLEQRKNSEFTPLQAKNYTMKQANDYFATSEVVQDEDSPEGKDGRHGYV